MGLFLRKAFSAGPFRINLSKSGLGLSVGVKGARVGMGPRGKYIHAGRGGLYYRNSLETSRRRTSSGQSDSFTRKPESVAEDRFIDTGVTYSSSIQRSIYVPVPAPSIRKETPAIWIIAAGIILSLFIFKHIAAFMIGISLIMIGAFLVVKNRKLAEENGIIETRLKSLEKSLLEDEKASFTTHSFPEIIQMDSTERRYYGYHVLRIISHALLTGRLEESNIKFNKEEFINTYELSPQEIERASVLAFKEIFDEFVDDWFLDEEEEQLIISGMKLLNIPEEAVKEELDSIITLSRMREQINRGLTEKMVKISLQRGEACYFEGEGRQLTKKILSRRQVDGVKYKDTGYDIEASGKLYITSKRLLMVSDGTRSISLDKIIDVTLTHSENLVEITVDGRVNSIWYTLPDAILFATILEQAIETRGAT